MWCSNRLTALPHPSVLLLTGALLFADIGCSVAPAPIPIHSGPGLFVEIVYDSHTGRGHSHPASVLPDDLAVILQGVQLRGRDVVGGFGLFGDDHGTPALTARDVTTLSPHLSKGLARASSRDVVTFYLLHRDAQGGPLITSGGIFVRDRHLYVILANARTSPSSVQYETPYEPNLRMDPLLPLARFKFVTGFVPADWRIVTSEAKRTDQWPGYLDESKVVVIDLDKLPK
jgi:hypothetical protein